MKTLAIARDLKLPLDVVTQTIAILAKRRAGKSYTMRRLVEQLLSAGQQVVLVDPKGDQWGVRFAADGKAPGLPVIILGGERGDVKLEAGAGEIVAKLVVEERVSVILDLSLFRKHEIATFMTAFMETLYRLKAREVYRTPMMLVIDEADAIAPQKPQKGEERMLGAAEDIVRRGGPEPGPSPSIRPHAATPTHRQAATLRPSAARASQSTDGNGLGKGEIAVLTAIAQHGAAGVTREQLSVLTGYKRSSRDTYLQKLSARGLATSPSGGVIVATLQGLDTLGPDFEPLPTGAALRDHWLRELPQGERVVFEAVVAAYPNAITRERIDELTGYKRSSRDTYLQKLSSRQLLETLGRGEVIASEALFS